MPKKSKWIPPFSRSPEFLRISVPVSEITFLTYLIKLLETNSCQSLEGSDREKILNGSICLWNIFLPKYCHNLFEGKVLLTPGKHRFKSVILQIENLKVINIFTSSFSPFVNLCEVIRFFIRIFTQCRNWYLSKTPFYKSSWRGSFCETWLVLWKYFEIITRIMCDNILPKHIKILGTLYSF